METQTPHLVSVAGGCGPYKNIREALNRLDLTPFKDKRVLVKPNAGRRVEASRGITTHPEAVAAVVDALREAGAAVVAIGESPILGVKTMEAFEISGIAAIAKERNVPLIDMDRRRAVIKEVPDGRVLETLRFCADIYDFDAIVSVPVTKSHMHTQVTLGIKNMKGCLWRHEKVRLHQLQYKQGVYFPEKTLDSAISDLATLLLPDLTVVDGYLGMEGLGPSAGEGIVSDFAVASFNPLAADKTACELMGFDFEEVVHLRLIRDRAICTVDSATVAPDDFRKFGKTYKKSPTKLDIEFPNVIVHDKGSCSACLSTTLLFLKRFADELGDYVLQDVKINIGIGKDIQDFTKGNLLIGNCTSPHKRQGLFVPGCPPVSSKIFKALTGVEPETNEPDVETVPGESGEKAD
ncbi:MAG: DUF362 domain-containing protein [Fibrobacterota bacterium]